MNFSKCSLILGFFSLCLLGCNEESEKVQTNVSNVKQTTEQLVVNVHDKQNPNKFPGIETLVEDNIGSMNVYVKDLYGPDYHYEACIGDSCSILSKDPNSKYYVYTCNKVNTKHPCSSSLLIKACNSSSSTCDKKIIDSAGPLKAKKVVVGFEHACAIRMNNTVKCWGKERGYSNLDAGQTADGKMASEIILSKTQNITCIIDPEHNLSCYGSDAKRFKKPIEKLVRDVSISINSICYVTLDGKTFCNDAEGEENAYIAYTDGESANIYQASDIRKVFIEEFYSLVYDFKNKITMYGFNLDNSKLKALKKKIVPIQNLGKIHDVSTGSDLACVVYGENRQVKCFGDMKSFDFNNASFSSRTGVQMVSVGNQSVCIIYKDNENVKRLECDGLPFYFEGVRNNIEANYISQGNTQVCYIKSNDIVDCVGNDYHRNRINFVPFSPYVDYFENAVVGISLPSDINPKLEQPICRINSSQRELICRITKFDFLPKDSKIRPYFDVNTIDGTLYIDDQLYVYGETALPIKKEYKVEVRSKNKTPVTYTLKLFQTMKINKTYSIVDIWDDEVNSPSIFNCVWTFSDGSIDENSCEKTINHVYETDFAEGKQDFSVKVDAYRKNIAQGGFDAHHYHPKPLSE